MTACFVRGMRNYATDPPREATFQDVYLYHVQPHLNRDGMSMLRLTVVMAIILSVC